MMLVIIKRLFKSVGVGYIYSRDINISENEFLKLKSFSENSFGKSKNSKL